MCHVGYWDIPSICIEKLTSGISEYDFPEQHKRDMDGSYICENKSE